MDRLLVKTNPPLAGLPAGCRQKLLGGESRPGGQLGEGDATCGAQFAVDATGFFRKRAIVLFLGLPV